MLIGISFRNAFTSSDDICSISVQCKQKSALLDLKNQTSYTTLYTISYPANSDAQNVPTFRRWRFEMKLSPFISHNDTHIVYDIGIRHRIPITMAYYVLVLSLVYIVPLINLNGPLK
jgi:hypothetical protein